MDTSTKTPLNSTPINFGKYSVRSSVGEGINGDGFGVFKINVSQPKNQDDPFAAKLDSDAAVLKQGVVNADAGRDAVAIATDAVSSLYNILGEIAEYSETAAISVTSPDQRDALDAEAKRLATEYSRVVAAAAYEGRALFSGTSPSLSINLGDSTASIDLSNPSVSFLTTVNDPTTTVYSTVELTTAASATASYLVASSALEQLETSVSTLDAADNRLAIATDLLVKKSTILQNTADQIREVGTAEQVASATKASILQEGLSAIDAHRSLYPDLVGELLGTSTRTDDSSDVVQNTLDLIRSKFSETA